MLAKRRALVLEAAGVLVLALIAGWWGARYVQQFRDAGRLQVFYQEYFEPALMIACGRGFTSAVQPVPAVTEFLAQRNDRFDCAQLPRDIELKPAQDVYQYAWLYLMWMAGLFWTAAGLSWSGLVPLFGALFASVIGLAYVVFRLSVPPLPAAMAAAALSMSMLHVQNLPHLRDYAKAPFMIALFLLLAWVVKHPLPPRRFALWGAAYGLVLGIGYGFRTDFLAAIPPLFVTALLFVPGFGARELGAKLGAVAAAMAVFAVVAWPVIGYVSRQGGCQWHAILLGLDHGYDDNLGVTPSYYQWTTHYSDEYMVAEVNGSLARAGRAPVQYCSHEYDRASGAYLLTIASHFPADVLTRAQASVARVMDLPFYLWTDRDPSIHRSPIGRLLTNVVGTARLAMMLAILAIGALNVRWGLFAVFAIVYFGGYPSMQFSPRHFFYLEFLGWWAMAFVGWHAIASARSITPQLVRRGLAFGVAVATLMLAPVPVVRAYHDRSVAVLTADLLSAPRAPVTATPTAEGLDLAVEAPAFLDVHVDLSACPIGVPLGVRYDPADPFSDFSSVIVPQPPGTPVARYLLPVYRGFEGLSTGGGPAGCIQRVERLESTTGIPLLPVLTLPANWRELPSHQSIGPDALRLWGLW